MMYQNRVKGRINGISTGWSPWCEVAESIVLEPIVRLLAYAGRRRVTLVNDSGIVSQWRRAK